MSVELLARVLRGADDPDAEGRAWPVKATARASAPVIRLVLIVLADRARYQRRRVNGVEVEGNLVYTGVPKLAAETDLSQGAVRFALAALREQGLIAPVGPLSGGRVATTYLVLPGDETATMSRDADDAPATTSRVGRDDVAGTPRGSSRAPRDDERTTRDVRRDEPENPEGTRSRDARTRARCATVFDAIVTSRASVRDNAPGPTLLETMRREVEAELGTRVRTLVDRTRDDTPPEVILAAVVKNESGAACWFRSDLRSDVPDDLSELVASTHGPDRRALDGVRDVRAALAGASS